MINALFAAAEDRWADYEAPLSKYFREHGLEVDLRTSFPPEEVDYIIYAPSSPVQDFTPFTRLKAVLNLWAGVESVVHNPTLKVPLTKMVEDGLTEGMVEWVTAHTLRYHLGIDAHINGQPGLWEPAYPPLARDRRVGILGLGALGAACASALVELNFQVMGWARSQKTIEGVICTSGASGLEKVLAHSEILILLLPATPDTENILNAETLAQLPEGARIINPGRGPLIDDAALLAALDSGQIGHATLDVFRVEPLPPEDPYWAHPKVTVTPHVASETRADTSSRTVAENIRRAEAGEPLLYVVGRDRAY